MARFDDYHRTVVGYHGTGLNAALRIVNRVEDFRWSERDYDWLGRGIYSHVQLCVRNPASLLGAWLQIGMQLRHALARGRRELVTDPEAFMPPLLAGDDDPFGIQPWKSAVASIMASWFLKAI